MGHKLDFACHGSDFEHITLLQNMGYAPLEAGMPGFRGKIIFGFFS